MSNDESKPPGSTDLLSFRFLTLCALGIAVCLSGGTLKADTCTDAATPVPVEVVGDSLTREQACAAAEEIALAAPAQLLLYCRVCSGVSYCKVCPLGLKESYCDAGGRGVLVCNSLWVSARQVDVAAELERVQGDDAILKLMLDQGKQAFSPEPKNSCSGSESCCCRVGNYGNCTTDANCAELNGDCVSENVGC